MDWEQLLSLKRFGDTEKRERKDQDETRLGFEVDYDRIVFSSEFRSLQNKTQVIPLSEKDFVHTRLTHSLEVSVVGRSLGRMVGVQLLNKYPHLQDLGYQANDFGAIVAAAALAHDIGNPPFGHSGEKAIGQFFISGKGHQFRSYLTDKEYKDLCAFEGNANGFKIMTESRQGRPGGLRLSYATLGAFMKYPKESLPEKPSAHIADKKYGFFQSEKDAFMEVAQELGLIDRSNEAGLRFARHPLTYLVEAADDICYTIIDFEDGINLGLISEDSALDQLINLVRDNINTHNYAQLSNTQDRVSYLRALAISTLIQETKEVFMAHEESIRQGDFDRALLDASRFKVQVKDIIDLSVQKVYQSTEVLEKEIAGYKILEGILEVFTTAIVHYHSSDLSHYHQSILKLFPKTLNLEHNSLYENLLGVCHFVASFSDRQAIQMHQKLQGNHF